MAVVVDAMNDDDVLRATRDRKAMVPQDPQVARVEPAVRGEDLGVELGALVVAAGDHRALDLQPADRAFGDHPVLGVHDADRGRGHWAADLHERIRVAGRGEGEVLREGDGRAGLGHPPSRFHRGPRQGVRLEDLQEGPRRLGDDGLSGVEDEAHRGQVPAPAGDLRSPIVDQAEGEIGRPGDGRPKSLDPIEPAQGVFEHRRDRRVNLPAADVDVAQVEHHDPAHVIQRHPVERNVLGREVVVLGRRSTTREQGLMGLHHGLRQPGAAGGEEQKGEIILTAGMALAVRLVPAESVDRFRPQAREAQQAGERADRREELSAAENQGLTQHAPGVGQLVERGVGLLVGGRDRERHRHEPPQHRGPEGDDEIVQLTELEEHLVPRLEAELAQPGEQPLSGEEQLRIALKGFRAVRRQIGDAALRVRAARLHPERGVTYLAPDGSKTFQSYPELLLAAQRLLAGLRELGLKPRDKVLFQLGQLDDFVVAFWASVLGGFVPVPLSIAPSYEQPNSALDKLANAWRMLGQPLILCSRELLSAVRSLSGLLGLPGLRAEAVDALRRHEPDRECHTCREDDLALLLLTSGSTGLPKAVMQTHQALLTRCASTAQNNDFTPEDVSLNWMPLDHVGGIVMFHLRDVYVGCRQVHAPITAVLEDPLRWLDWIERFRATVTWAPNFAFGLVNDRAAEIARRSWDLSSMRFILNAGEAIVAKTARTFLQILEPHALPGTAMKPAWGMSETCSAITFSQDFTLASTSNTDSFVEVGSPVPAAAVRIVDAENRVVAEGTIGRLQVKGPMITGGYYQRPELDSEVFTADGWFDTGDLGVLRNHRLSITGRAKDVIIVHGINYYSHEIESVVEEVSGVEVSYTAACPVRTAGSDTDELAIFFHTPEEDWGRRLDLIEEIRQRVTAKSGLNPTYVIPMAREDIPKTAIGKIQRPQLRQQLEAGKLADVLKRIDLLTGSPRTLPAWFYRRVWRPRERAPRTAVQPGGRWLIFLDPHGLGADLCRRLARRGQTSIEVALGPEYRQIDARRFVLNPGQADHYRWLLQSLVSLKEPIDRVVHLWTAGEPGAEVVSLETLRRAQERGVLSVLFLVQALVEARGDRQPMELSVVSRHAQVN